MAPGGAPTNDKLVRLHRIEGQVRGVERMIEAGAPCVGVLDQNAATIGALRSAACRVLDEHAQDCIRRAAAGHDGGSDVAGAATSAIERLVRS